MLGEVGAVLPMAFGIAISPIPIIATLLLLMAPKARAASLGFAIGWVTGVLACVTAFTLLAGSIPSGAVGQPGPIAGTLKLLLGAGLLFLAWRQWQSRPGPGDEAQLPGWMAAVDTMSVARATGVAFLLAGLNPKNLLLAAAAGLIIGEGDHQVFTASIFVALASVSVAGLVVIYQLAGERLGERLQAGRGWLVQNNATVMAVLLLVLGTVTIGKGTASW